MKRARVRNRIRLQAPRALEVGSELDAAVDLVRAGAVALLGVGVDSDGTDARALAALELRGRNLERGMVRPGAVFVDVIEVDDRWDVLHDSLGPNLGPVRSISG